MAFLKRIYQSAWFIPVVVFTCLTLLIWFAGPYIAFAEYYPLAEISNRLILLISMLLIYSVVKLYQYHKSMKLQTQMVDDITEDAGLDEVINAEASELKRKFEHAFSLLKANKNSVSLTDMPWYMIIGSPGSGKTTLLSNSGLKFPLFNEFSNQAIQGVGGTKNCDWWITQDAVLLDTAGRYTSRDSQQQVDESGWKNFLSLIKKYRRKPISGLLVSFSLSDLLTMNEYELGQQLILMKQRISEINQFFNTRFPVYVVLTKCDMLAGFTQFFENFSHKEREQTFGITFDPKDTREGSAVGVFANEFKQLVSSLSRRQWQRISLERDASRKALIYSFTSQLSSLLPTLQNVVESLSEKDNNLTNGILRGVYFTSGTQHGAPIDRMIAKVSQTFGLRSNAQVLWNNDTRSYFIKELLQQVVFPESDRFGVLASYEKRKNLIKRVSFLSATALALVLCVGWFVSYNNNVTFIETSETAVKNWNSEYQSSGQSDDIRNYLPALNDFSTNMALLEEQKQASFSGLGLAQSNSLQEGFEASYNRLLKIVLLPFVKEQIEQQMRKSGDTINRYQALKAYLMLANADKRDQGFLSAWLKDNLANSGQFNDNEKIQLTAHTNHLITNDMPIDSLNEGLVDTTRQSLKRASLTDLYYQQFKQPYVDDANEMISMDQLAGADWRSVFSLSIDEIKTMSALFTPEKFKQVQTTMLASYIAQLDSESWILGENNVVNKTSLAKQLLTVYSRDYVRNWQKLLQSVKVKYSSNTQALESSLMISSGIDSPMLYLLETVAQSTLLTGEGIAGAAADLAASKSSSANRLQRLGDLRDGDSPEAFITGQFAKLHELMSKDRKLILQQRMSARFSDLALNLAQPGDIGNSEQNIKSIKALQALAYTQPEPLKQWLTQFVDNINGIVSNSNRQQIAQRWQQDFLPQCNNIIGYKYPFDSSSTTYASARDLATLFAETGLIQQFFKQNIEPLLQSSRRPWRWKTSVAASYGFNDQVLPFFEQVDTVRQTLFASGGTTPQMNLSVTPMTLSDNVKKFNLNLYGKQLSYQFGRPITTNFVWPPENPGAGAYYSFIRLDGSEVMNRESDIYALFKLFDSGSVKTLSSTAVEVTFAKEAYSAVYKISAQQGADPMVFARLSNFQCLADL